MRQTKFLKSPYKKGVKLASPVNSLQDGSHCEVPFGHSGRRDSQFYSGKSRSRYVDKKSYNNDFVTRNLALPNDLKNKLDNLGVRSLD